jgi:FtsP/CotA-like multicopper oxidase with cupredoxin domain
MSSAQKGLLLVVTLVVLVGGFVLLSPSSNDGGNDTAGITSTVATSTGTSPDTTTAAPQQPAANTIVVQGGKPVGGIKTIKAKNGDHVVIEVSSPDTTSEVHFHGYDIKRELKAGGKVTFAFDANAEGIFEMELEQTGVQIAKIEISPS